MESETKMEINGNVYILESEAKKQELIMPKMNKGMEYCIVRTYSAGVFAGYWNRKIKGREGTIFNSRRIFYWDGANSLSELAIKGTSKQNNCKFAVIVPETDLKEVIEVIPCTTKAKQNIEGVKIWQH